MTIIEAIKSGKRFRRSGDRDWLFVGGDPEDDMVDRTVCYMEGEGTSPQLMWAGDILADDWEVEEKKVALTRTDIEAAYCRVPCFAREKPFLELFIKELGL